MAIRIAAAFAGGAIIGGATVAVLQKQKQQVPAMALPAAGAALAPVPTPAPAPLPVPVPAPPVKNPTLPATPGPMVPAVPTPTTPGTPAPTGNIRMIMPHGFPGPVNDLFVREGYVASYNRQLRHPNWVAEHITADTLKAADGVGRGNSQFKEDSTVPDLYRAKLSDYLRSGYDRGHMVPAADVKKSQTAMDETFFLSNIAPQDVDQRWYVKHEVIGNPPNIAVPTHFYKIVLTDQGNGQMAVGAFVLPNNVIQNEVPLTSFQVPVEAVEKASGLKFFEMLERRALKNLCQETDCKILPHPKSLKNKAIAA
ncbi:nuclease [Actinomortierella ambigua]|nr:nuclease [Actinomortierella ambigua]